MNKLFKNCHKIGLEGVFTKLDIYICNYCQYLGSNELLSAARRVAALGPAPQLRSVTSNSKIEISKSFFFSLGLRLFLRAHSAGTSWGRRCLPWLRPGARGRARAGGWAARWAPWTRRGSRRPRRWCPRPHCAGAGARGQAGGGGGWGAEAGEIAASVSSTSSGSRVLASRLQDRNLILVTDQQK